MAFPTFGHPPQNPSNEPLYNIGVVSRMTDIPVATLRVWERRYEFPESSRTSGGHRLYSEREILRLRWVKARIDEGMQTGRAIRALHHLEQDNRLPDSPFAGMTRPVQPASRAEPAVPRPTPSPASAAAHEQLTAALIAHDMEQANQIISDALAVSPVESLMMDVIQPTLVSIGQAWHDGAINVATEHLATNFIRNRLLMWLSTGPATHNVPPIVLACAPDEWHEMTLLIFGVMLRRLRWPIAYLGQAVPLPDLAAFVEETGPDVVALVAMTENTAGKLARWPQALPEAHRTGRPVICYAGHIFSTDSKWQENVPGIYLGDSMQDGVDTINRILADLHQLPG